MTGYAQCGKLCGYKKFLESKNFYLTRMPFMNIIEMMF
jgi:hypothetical protein